MPPELSLTLLRHGYDALPRLRARAADPDAYEVRMLGRPALVVRGEEGARFFYDDAVMTREGAVPVALAGLLFGTGTVQGLDGDAHAARKRIFVDLLGAEEVGRLGRCTAQHLDETADRWPQRPSFALFDELVRVYGAAVLDWAGTGCTGAQAERVSRDLATIVAGFGGRPLAYPQGWRARVRANRWARDVVGAAREGRLVPRSGSAVDAFVTGGGRDLPLDVAAAELVNVVRPTVAVAWFGAFAALALAEAPHYGSRLAEDPAFRVAFAHEVRRLSPFAPAVAARAMTAVSHRGVQVQTGGRVVLDIPGTNTHPASWEDAERFLPERFLDREIGPYCYVPQGGGPLATGHRCPGEDVATALLTVTLERLARTAYAAQRPHVRRDRIPTLPRGGLEVAVTRTDPVPSTSTQG